MGFLSALSTFVSIILVYPVYYVAFCAYFLLSLVASPFIYLGSLCLWLVLLPVKIVLSLKALLIYLGVASLAGAGAALLLYSITTLAIDALLGRVSSSTTVARLKPRPGHHAIEDVKSEPSNGPGESNALLDNWGWGVDANPLKKSGLVSETILEEESQNSEI
ncbi:uncharacterized protein APUU_10713A [Aspergillus puulaauensis]|uniref:Uncharacterized protein n=1 Tax=Aspergillus puulaauensis TaxID=1220207 RepID=A0A7R7XAW9_9EURO|nr:uncharacterized protein APUU_10713A [Aspergillus puulaauensis]BCS17885.1 hypothetical protein APUU_10713A [Aspergillus puulaauensis]